METGKEYPVYAFEAKDDRINGKYLVAADNLEAAKIYVNKVHYTISQIIINIESGTEFENLKYICPYWNNGINAICIINALHCKPC